MFNISINICIEIQKMITILLKIYFYNSEKMKLNISAKTSVARNVIYLVPFHSRPSQSFYMHYFFQVLTDKCYFTVTLLIICLFL